jgi:superfamily II DNA/RNA helicase
MATNQVFEHMPKKFVWSSKEGHQLCHDILKHKLPYKPYQVQVKGVCKVLDGVDLLATPPTGMGKTTFISIHMLVVLAIKEDPTLCPNMNIPNNPCTMVICPTKYLKHQMVSNIHTID